MDEIRMPSLGADMEDGTLVEWKVAVGDHVSRGDIVGLIETQKATMELESFADGVIEALLVEPGTKVAVGTVLAKLSGATVAMRAAPPVAPAPAARPPVPAPAGAATLAPMPMPTPTPTLTPHVRSSPAARKRALELGIDLATIQGSGPHGAIVLRDVVPAPPAPPRPRRMPELTGPVRDAIAVAMSRSKREIPHFYLSHTISMKRALTWLAETNRERSIQERILPGAMLLRAVALALWDFSELNGFYIDGRFQPSEEVHLATAIALRTGGLIAPALLDADSIPLPELMRELQDLVVRARAGHLRSSELSSATITVTSLGDRGCEAVYPVINPPQVAIIGFGAILERAWVEGSSVVPHPTIVATLAADHRVSDGHRGGLFLATVDRLLQEPGKL